MLNKIRNKVIDKVSDVLSYPARRAAQKSMINSDKEYKFIKDARNKGYTTTRENKIGGGTELIAKKRQMQALQKIVPKKQTYGAVSNGIGVGP